MSEIIVWDSIVRDDWEYLYMHTVKDRAESVVRYEGQYSEGLGMVRYKMRDEGEYCEG